MASYAARIAGTGNVAGAGNPWSTSGANITADDNTYEQSGTSVVGTVTTQTLQAYNFGHAALLAGETIASISVNIARLCSDIYSGSVKDAALELMVGGVSISDNVADTVTTWPGTETVTTYDKTAAQWNVSTTADVGNTGFGVQYVVDVTKSGSPFTIWARIDYISLALTTNDPPAGGGAHGRGCAILLTESFIDWLDRLRCPLQPEQWAPGVLACREIGRWCELDRIAYPIRRRLARLPMNTNLRLGALTVRTT